MMTLFDDNFQFFGKIQMFGNFHFLVVENLVT